MSRLINADDIKYTDMLAPMGNGNYEHVGIVTESEIEAMPAVDAVPVVHGKWIPWKYHDGFRCEKCNEPVYNKHNYCSNCGARMDAERKEE